MRAGGAVGVPAGFRFRVGRDTRRETMNADRMIAVFLSGVLVGGSVVYLSPNNGLQGQSSGQHQGTQTGAGGQGGGGPAGGQASASAQAATPSGDVGSSGGGAAASSSGLAEATPAGQLAGAGPGAPGSLEATPVEKGGSATTSMADPGGDPSMQGGSGGDSSMQGGSSGGDPSMQGGGGQMGGGGMEPSPISATPTAGAPRGATRLLRHLQLAPTLWKAQAEAALASKDPKVKALAGDIAAHAANVPTVSDRLPPVTEITSYLYESKLLLDKMNAAGMDVSSLQTQIDEVSKARH